MASTSSDVSTEEGSKSQREILHPNFHKPDLRASIMRTDSETHMAERADKKYSRYFVKSRTEPKFHHMEEPNYYYDVSLDPTPEGSSHGSSGLACVSSPIVEKCAVTLAANEEDDDEEEFEEVPGATWRDILRPRRWRKVVTLKYFLASTFVLVFIVVGTVVFLVVHAREVYSTPKPQVVPILSPYDYPILSALRKTLIDPDTPKHFHTKVSNVTGETWELVFSDEFNVNGRTFYPGDDQFFTAADFHYGATQDLEYYLPDMITTHNGTLQIKLDAFRTKGLDYRSGMLQSWNQLCYNKNALVEVSAKMPGDAGSKGLWPAVWSLGNLGRPGFRASTDGIWPYTYDECDFGITPNQSSPDGMSYLPGQRLSKCTCYGEEHPSIGLGRGAPEIDIIEGFHDPHGDWSLGAQTLQVAPFDPWWRPDYDYMTVANQQVTFLNPNTGTPTQEAIASMTVLNDTWFADTDQKGFQKYGFEYLSLKSSNRDSYIRFYVGEDTTMMLHGDSLHPKGNVGWRHISREPMALIFNLALSPTWADIDFNSLEFPATFEIDYVRIYQPRGHTEMTCDPDDYPTSEYINSHFNAYSNANLTTWKQAGYKWPRNSLMNGCSAPI